MNTSSCSDETAHKKRAWEAIKYLKLNCSKSEEIVITARGERGRSVTLPSPDLNIERVSCLTVECWVSSSTTD